jgi:hypothetical protein
MGEEVKKASKRIPAETRNEVDLLKRIKELESLVKAQGLKVDNTPIISSEEYIEVISLCPYSVTVTTEPKGRGYYYTWPRFGGIYTIMYSDLQRLIKNHGNGVYTDFFREGYLYINNPAIVRKSGLQEVYKNLLNYEQFEEVLKCESEKCIELFKSATSTHRKFICQLLIDKLVNGEKLDLNIIDQLSRIAKIEIVKEAEDAKSFLPYKIE